MHPNAWAKPEPQLLMPDVASIKKELAQLILDHWSVSASIRLIVVKYSLHNYRWRGNAWIDDICGVHAQL